MTAHHRLTIATAASLTFALAGAGVADGKIRRFGSSLKARATASAAHQADTAYWHNRLPGRRFKAPASGQVLSVKIKGRALSDKAPGQLGGGGETIFHLQTLQPLGGNRMRVKVTSQSFDLPNRSARPQKITTYRPTNMCIAKGEIVAFNHVGGWDGIADQSGPYPRGTPLRIFARKRRAAYRWFEGSGQTNNGATFGSRRRGGRELLMQVRLGTGRHGTGLCPGGTKTSAVTGERFRRTGAPVPRA